MLFYISFGLGFFSAVLIEGYLLFLAKNGSAAASWINGISSFLSAVFLLFVLFGGYYDYAQDVVTTMDIVKTAFISFLSFLWFPIVIVYFRLDI